MYKVATILKEQKISPKATKQKESQVVAASLMAPVACFLGSSIVSLVYACIVGYVVVGHMRDGVAIVLAAHVGINCLCAPNLLVEDFMGYL